LILFLENASPTMPAPRRRIEEGSGTLNAAFISYSILSLAENAPENILIL
jgi:hypothetical protein